MTREATWTNSDGLVVGFGTRTVDTTFSTIEQGGKLVLNIKGSDLADANVAAQLVNAPVIPAGCIVTHARLVVDTAFAGATAVLDIGVYKASDGTAVDDDGIDSAIAVATLVDAYDVLCDGALIGDALAFDSKIAASYDTAAFTAGHAVLEVFYRKG